MGVCQSSLLSENKSEELAVTAANSAEVSKVSSERVKPKGKHSDTDKKGHLNHALVFIKPHAVNELVEELVVDQLKSNGITVDSRGTFTHEDLEGIIDSHYATLAQHAMHTKPEVLCSSVTEKTREGFKKKYGTSIDEALQEKRFVNLTLLKERFPDLTAVEIDECWTKSSEARYKLAPGTYVSLLELPNTSDSLWVVNGFYAAMREKYVREGASVVYFSVFFPESELSWKDFRAKVVGATEPSKADSSSIRSRLHAKYKEFGLEKAPDIGDNGIHASAGPVEGLKERMTWLGNELGTDPFGKRLIDAGVPLELAKNCCENKHIDLGKLAGNAFDILEDVDSSEVITHLSSIG